MSKYTILATNDDGIDSPLFLPFIDALSASSVCQELRFVVPAEEHSWIAQAATPKRPVFTTHYERNACRGFVASGTPADCVSLGVHNVYPTVPEFLISGINIGSNAGLAFYLSSGTIGASRQAFLHQIPTIAFSVKMPPELFQTWGRHDLAALSDFASDWQRISTHCVRIAERLTNCYSSDEIDLISVNLPWTVDQDTPIVLTSLQRTYYQELFHERAPGEFIHQPKGMSEESLVSDPSSKLEGDREVVARGEVSVCPIRYELAPRNQAYLETLRKSLLR